MIAFADTTFHLPEAKAESLPASPGDPGPCPFDVAVAARRHMACINALCDEVGRPFQEVAEIYHSELRRLSENASVMDYLPVLVSKRVRRLYQQRLHALGEAAPCCVLPPNS